MGSIKLNAVEKWYGEVQVIKGVDLEIEDGEFIVFVGPSGCGKSTLLRMIGGLEDISRGTLDIDGRDVTAEPPAKRGLAMVFQSYALYPHMSVRDNMGFSLKTAGAPKSEINEKVEEAARVLKLEPLLDRRPKDMSGGQRQRVAIGRSIVRAPTAFLFDEPLSNLDAALRVDMRLEIAKLHQSLKTTMIYVTHDQVEAMTLADKIVVLRGGDIEQVGAPIDLYERPQNTFVAQFIGSPKMNFFAPSNLAATAPKELASMKDEDAIIGIRSEHMRLCSAEEATVSATFELVENLGEHALVHMKTQDGVEFIAKLETPPAVKNGDMLHFTFADGKTHVFDKATGARRD